MATNHDLNSLKKTVVRVKLEISRKSIWYIGQNNLHAFVRHWASPSNVFSHLLQNLLSKKSSFSSYYRIKIDNKWK